MSSNQLWGIYQQLLVLWKQLATSTAYDLHSKVSAALLQCKTDLINQLDSEPVVPSASLAESDFENVE